MDTTTPHANIATQADTTSMDVDTDTRVAAAITPMDTTRADTVAVPNATQADTAVTSDTFFNLAVNQKAVYQPTFKVRRWLEKEKHTVGPGDTLSIKEIESRFPPL
ncbi:hypothetical protein BGX34_005750, partial [Mortierella sp. NVP85]